MLKTARIRDLVQYISNQNMKAIINLMVSYKQNKALKDDNLKYSMVEDSNYISERVTIRGLLKILQIFIGFIFTVYLAANFWIAMVILTVYIHIDTPAVGVIDSQVEDEFGDTFIHNDGNWSFDHLNDFDYIVQVLYFTFTSLSTVGFGDMYPITDSERLVCSFLLLFGVLIFSYTEGELHTVLVGTILDN